LAVANDEGGDDVVWDVGISMVAACDDAAGASWLVLCEGTAALAVAVVLLTVTRVAPLDWLRAAACAITRELVIEAEEFGDDDPDAVSPLATADVPDADWALAFVAAFAARVDAEGVDAGGVVPCDSPAPSCGADEDGVAD